MEAHHASAGVYDGKYIIMKFSHTRWNKLGDAYANRTEPESFRILASTYWHALLYITITIVLLAVSYGLWQFVAVFAIPEEPQMLVPSGTRAPIIDRAELEGVVEGFKDREGEYNSLRSNPPSFVDPSK